MIPGILRIVENTAKDLFEDFSGLHQNNNGSPGGMVAFNEGHLHDALDLIYSQDNQMIMEPMRVAMAAVLDATLFFQIHRSTFLQRLRTYPWILWIPQMQVDYAEFRRRTGFGGHGSIIPTDEALEAMLAHPDLRHTASVEI
jgi:hypothetical protein